MEAQSTVKVPRIAIRFCTQCKWNLRAAYYAQELLQTFSTSIGEISLLPVTGGIFDITLLHQSSSSSEIQNYLIWDRKRDSGFPETKELKNRIRNVIEPDKDMGHIDRSLRKGKEGQEKQTMTTTTDDQQDHVARDEDSRSGKKADDDASGGQRGVARAIDPETGKPKEDCEDCK